VRVIKISFIIICLMAMQNIVYAQNPSDYLILQSIGDFSSDGKGKCGNGSGVLGGTDHFDEDHNVITCVTDYYNFQQKMAVEIKVEQHTGGDSDRWLLHEVEDSYRDSDIATLGMLTDGAVMRRISQNGVYQRVLWIGIGGGSFTWVSNNVVIKISYTDLQGTKPEPIEVVKAYLIKFPSTITLTDADFKASAHSIQWIKDEIDRRLWLCDKWNAQFQAGQAKQADLIYNLDRSMGVFLYYRQKYFGISSAADREALLGYKINKDLVPIQKKLTEYKTWWSANKGMSITLP
jgi:hypothetical protein